MQESLKKHNKAFNWLILKKNSHPVIFFYFVYTIIFLIGFEFCYGIYFQHAHKTYIWQVDGFEIVYTQFVYAGRWIRTVAKNIFINHSFSIPMWDMSLGYGSDIIATNASTYLTLTDPFFLIAALFPLKYSEFAFELMITLKIYTAGIAFCVFARKQNTDFFATLSGASVYIFASSIYICFVQPGFLNQFILFPLIMLGVEKIWKKEKPHLFIISLAFSMALSMYFTYMIAILVVFYCVVKWLTDIKKYSLKEIVGIFIKFFMYSLLACVWGGIIAISTISMLLSLGRLSVEHYIPKFYDDWLWKGMVVGFTSFFASDTDWYVCFSVVVLICIFALLVVKGLFKEKIIIVALTVSLFIPYIGHIFNGFNYAANRWIFGYAFFVSYTVSLMFNNLYKINKWRIGIVTVLFVAYCIIRLSLLDTRDFADYLIIVLGIIICFLSLFSGKISKNLYNMIFLAIVFLSCLLTGYFAFSSKKKNLPSEQLDKGIAAKLLMESGGKPLLNVISNGKLTRFDQCLTGMSRNSSTAYGISGMDYYYSIYDNNIDIFNKELAVGHIDITNMISGLDRRSLLEKLVGTNYYIVMDDRLCPVGFDTLESSYTLDDGRVFNMWTRTDSADMIYAFDRSMNEDYFDKFDAYGKQNLLMQAVLMDNKDAEKISLTSEDLKDYQDDDIIEYEIVYADGLEFLSNDNINVYQDEACIVMKLKENISNAEICVLVNNLMHKSENVNSFNYSVDLYYDDEFISGISKNILTPMNHMYKEQENRMLNYGTIYGDKKINNIKIIFRTQGEYSFGGLKIYAEPIDRIYDLMGKLKHCTDEVDYNNNTISAMLTLDNDAIVFISVPFMKGWKAKVDGKETEIYKADMAFMAVKINAGVHKLYMEYKTPFVGLSIFAGVLLWVYVLYALISASASYSKV